MLGKLLCKLGIHKVPNRHYLSPAAWSGPCVRKNCGVTVSTAAYVKKMETISRVRNFIRMK